MEIPEELLKMPEKELKEVLTPNVFKAKYFKIPGHKKVAKLVTKVKNLTVVTSENKIPLAFPGKLDDALKKYKVTPLLYSDITAYLNNKLIYKNPDSIKAYVEAKLKSLFSEEYFEIVYEAGNIYITIYQPEILIRNSLGTEHTMKEVYVQFTFTKTKLIQVYLFRGKYTPQEAHIGYMFSHSLGFNGSSDFCYGETPFSKYIDSCKNTFNLKNLDSFITAFLQYLQWESIEGTPYNYIDRIYINNTWNLTYLEKESEEGIDFWVNRLLKEFNHTNIDFDYEFDCESNNSCPILNKDKFIELFNSSYDREKNYIINGHTYSTELKRFEDTEWYNWKGHSMYFKENIITACCEEDEEVNKRQILPAPGVSQNLVNNVYTKCNEIFKDWFLNEII